MPQIDLDNGKRKADAPAPAAADVSPSKRPKHESDVYKSLFFTQEEKDRLAREQDYMTRGALARGAKIGGA